jgi:hypothetical protein
MRYAAPIVVEDDDAWLDPDPSGGIVDGRRWAAPIVVDELDDAWNEQAAVRLAGMAVAAAGEAGPGDPLYDYLAGTRDALPVGWPDNALPAGVTRDTPFSEWPNGTYANAAGQQAADADEMRTRIATAETELATGHIIGNGPLDDAARAEREATVAPPAWVDVPLPAVVENPHVPPGVIYLMPTDQALALPGRIEPVAFEPVRFAAPVILDHEGDVVPPRLAAKRQMLIDVVKAYAAADPRSNQVEIGPSEIGDPCDSRVMRRALGMPAVAWPDPWASFVGTAVHAKLADAFEAANAAGANPGRFLLERRVWMTDGMSGSTDLTEHLSTTSAVAANGVVDIYDHKVLGTDTFRETKAEKLAPTSKYGVQLDTYALGWRRAGYEVRTINLALWPRSGFLDGLLVIEREPNYANAEGAIDRVSALRQWALERGADESDEPWSEVPTAPGKGCGFCPFYNPHRPLGRESCDLGREHMAGAKRGTGPRKSTP